LQSHPPSLVTLARRVLVEANVLPKSGRVRILVAVSGGRDSMTLLHVLALLRRKLPLELLAHGVDHGLRPEAAAELDLARDLAASLDVPFRRSTIEVAPGSNLMARARDARYAVLEAAARDAGASFIATGHHMDDRAETVLLRLLRGSGPRGLAVLPPRSQVYEPPRIRPLVRARRAAIDAHATRHRLSFADDPSNASVRFLRTRVRLELIPLLETLSPSIVVHLTALSDQLIASRGVEVSDYMHPLPRATQLALAELARTRSTKARIELPGALVATFDRTQVQVMVPPSAKPGPSTALRGQRPPK
jgi:tRNA(Ile)-lysidine synthase